MTDNFPRKSIELHIIHSFPASNLNRDDTGNPKDCIFGGAHRLRVSSQCFKRAIRHNPIFKATTVLDNGIRTKRLVDKISDELHKAGKDKTASKDRATKFVKAVYSKLDEKRPEMTAVLLYVSPREITWAVDNLIAAESDEDISKCAAELTDILKKRTTSAPDIALFGRMLAEHPDSNVDAACQVAHAISTHAVKTEVDFYTAVDDLKPEDKSGADMIGVIAFGSACYYRYARLDWNQLVKNLEGDTELAEKTAKAFLLASEAANPSGMANSHDNNTRPSLLLAVVRDDSKGASWSLVNTFEEPVFSRNGYVNESVKRMEDYWDGLIQLYGADSVRGMAILAHSSVRLNGSFTKAKKETLSEWADAVLEDLR